MLRPEQRMAKIGLVSNYNGPDQPMQVSFNSVCTEKKDGEIETEISVVRTQVYHLPKEPWFELMWMKGTPIPPSFYEEIRNHKSVREMVALGQLAHGAVRHAVIDFLLQHNVHVLLLAYR